jgi:hypothetical protein
MFLTLTPSPSPTSRERGAKRLKKGLRCLLKIFSSEMFQHKEKRCPLLSYSVRRGVQDTRDIRFIPYDCGTQQSAQYAGTHEAGDG